MDDAAGGSPTPGDRDRGLVAGVLAREPRALAKAITLVESTRPDHRARALALLDALLPHAGGSIRVGVTGAPGAGKSTFIEALGLSLVGRGRRVAVLAVDPSSSLSGGSILGDKTRMGRLSQAPGAFIRPSPSGGSLGGVAGATREALLVCEAAGFDVVLVETVGVGQSETAVAGMADVFVLLQNPNAGDDLQAIKRGVVELADVVVVNKADLDPDAAHLARQQLSSALMMVRHPCPGWTPPALLATAATGAGVDAFWSEVERFRDLSTRTGEHADRRRRQDVAWMWALVDAGLRDRFRRHPLVRRDLDALRLDVSTGLTTPAVAARRLLGHLDEPGADDG